MGLCHCRATSYVINYVFFQNKLKFRISVWRVSLFSHIWAATMAVITFHATYTFSCDMNVHVLYYCLKKCSLKLSFPYHSLHIKDRYLKMERSKRHLTKPKDLPNNRELIPYQRRIDLYLMKMHGKLNKKGICLFPWPICWPSLNQNQFQTSGP